ncbi:MAG: type II toxin-antitoxin system PemK/MazF family toxin [Verrucomicrobia bacterium]|nr:type II toxin-antitoxin system PemK/MazF family toxin [Verrucomicrobiota bacterium]
MREGAVILIPLPQADGVTKNRPALVLRQLPKFGDWLVCGLSTQLAQYVPGFDELLDPKNSDYKASGVMQPSVVRLGFLAVVPQTRVLGTIGVVSPERHARLLHNLASHLVLGRR